MSWHDEIEGYPRLGSLMGTNPALAIFRRYSALNARTLLYMQAELNKLESDLHGTALEDSCDPEKAAFSREWWKLAGAKDGDLLQWEQCLEIRAKLDQYCLGIFNQRC